MKNIHILPTQKPSKLVLRNADNKLVRHTPLTKGHGRNQNIYITSDEEIKADGEWYYNTITNAIFQMKYLTEYDFEQDKKIILTTDQDLIKDGVQEIDDEFLEWFVKNPSCEEVETYSLGIKNEETGESCHYKYEIIIPKEEPKQETLEEAAQRAIKSGLFKDKTLFEKHGEFTMGQIEKENPKLWEAYQEALKIEKEQHEKTWFDSTAQFDNAAEMTYKKLFVEYYNETFKKK